MVLLGGQAKGGICASGSKQTGLHHGNRLVSAVWCGGVFAGSGEGTGEGGIAGEDRTGQRGITAIVHQGGVYI